MAGSTKKLPPNFHLGLTHIIMGCFLGLCVYLPKSPAFYGIVGNKIRSVLIPWLGTLTYVIPWTLVALSLPYFKLKKWNLRHFFYHYGFVGFLSISGCLSITLLFSMGNSFILRTASLPESFYPSLASHWGAWTPWILKPFISTFGILGTFLLNGLLFLFALSIYLPQALKISALFSKKFFKQFHQAIRLGWKHVLNPALKETQAFLVSAIKDLKKEGKPALQLHQVNTLMLPGAPTKPKKPSQQQAQQEELRFSPPVILETNKAVVMPKTIQGTQSWKLPSTDLLTPSPQETVQIDRQSLLSQSNHLESKLNEFSISGQVVAVKPGPVITMFEFKPGTGVRIAQIASRSDDISLALEAQSVRIVAPIPGRNVVGIEIPNAHRETLYVRPLLESEGFHQSSYDIPIIIGKDISGEPVFIDLAATPHLLVAGSSGAGKSVFINTLILSLLYRFSPDELKFIMVDPKQLELSLYEDIPHLLLPVVDQPHTASIALKWACQEMERRYTLMARAGVRNIKGFNQKLSEVGEKKLFERNPVAESTHSSGEPTNEPVTASEHLIQEESISHMPYIVVIIDEFADLMMTARKEVENHVNRLAAKARAAGIHLVIATQRPSTDVITGVIKNNLPSRIAFKVPSQIDSRTILDAQGAEKLLGKGDLLLIPPGQSRIIRAHGGFLTEVEIEKVCQFWRKQGTPQYRDEILIDTENESPEDSSTNEDPLYNEAVELVREEGVASASRLQRRFRIGYNRAARLIETMEARGLVSKGSGSSKPRDVIDYRTTL